MLHRSENPRGQQAFDVSIAFTVIAFICVALRLYTRWFIVRSPGIEDHLVIIATVSIPVVDIADSLTDPVPVFLHRSDGLHSIP